METSKKEFRKKSLQSLRTLTNRYYHNKKSLEHLSRILKQVLPPHKSSQSILFYMPLDFEVNLLPLALKYRQKHRCFIPFIIEDINFKMIPLRYPFIKNKFDIKESLNSDFYKQHIDIMIVPMIGYDKAFRRIGFGKGMYDRFFSRLKGKPLVIFVQTKSLFSKTIITQTFDIKAHIIIHSKGVIFNHRYIKRQ